MSNIIEGITKDLKAIPKNLKAKAGGMDTKKLVLLNLPYIFVGYFCDKVAWLWRVAEGTNASDKMMAVMSRFDKLFANPLPNFHSKDLLIGVAGGWHSTPSCSVLQSQECQEVPAGCRIRFRKVECIILSVKNSTWTHRRICT